MHIFNSVFASFYFAHGRQTLLQFSITCKLWNSKPNWRLGYFAAVNHNYGDSQWTSKHRINKMDRNLTNHDWKTWPFDPAEVSFCFLRGPLRWLTVAKKVNRCWGLNFRVHVIINCNKFALKNKLHQLHVMQWFFITCSCDVTCTWILCHYLFCDSYSFSYCLHKLSIKRYKIKLLE